jgi:hypothetical protein
MVRKRLDTRTARFDRGRNIGATTVRKRLDTRTGGPKKLAGATMYRYLFPDSSFWYRQQLEKRGGNETVVQKKIVPEKKKNASIKHRNSPTREVKKSQVEERVLSILAQLHVLGIKSPKRIHVAHLVGCTHVSSTEFLQAMSKLKNEGCIMYPGKDKVSLTECGLARAPAIEPPTSNEEVQSYIKKLLVPKAAQAFDILSDGCRHTRQHVAGKLGYTHLLSSGFTGVTKALREFDLVLQPKDQTTKKTLLQLSDIAFPFGRPSYVKTKESNTVQIKRQKSKSRPIFSTGAEICKEFPGYGLFRGVVMSICDDDGEILYRIRYDDGDTEELQECSMEEYVEAAKRQRALEAKDVHGREESAAERSRGKVQRAYASRED